MSVTPLNTANIYENNHDDKTILDLSGQGLDDIPAINNSLFLQVLYVNSNRISMLPEHFFPSLPNLTYLDLRDNYLTEIPSNIQYHPCLTHLLLQNNKISKLPNELGMVPLKVLQFSGNPLMYPSKAIIKEGVTKILKFLQQNYFDEMQYDAQTRESNSSISEISDNFTEARSYNSVLDLPKIQKTLSVKFNEKEMDNSEEDAFKIRLKKKCPKLSKSRNKTLPPHSQSAKYLRPVYADSAEITSKKIKLGYIKDVAQKKHREMLAIREKTLQDRKTFEYLRNWRQNYKEKQLYNRPSKFPSEMRSYPYDTSPEFMTFLTREDIEKDLPDKYKKRLSRRSKQTVPRKNNNDVHLALKIKELFDNLDSVDLTRQGMSPRSEQRALLTEIEKISEIRQKLKELSTTNGASVAAE